MKNILIGLMILVSTMCSAQINSNKTTPINKIDTTKLCFPAEVGKQILIDLNECDKNKELLKLTEQEVTELNNKITQKDNIINSLNLNIYYLLFLIVLNNLTIIFSVF